MSPRKIGRITKNLRGLSASEAEAQLSLSRGRCAQPLQKLLVSAVANAKQNEKISGGLWVKRVVVNEGPSLKRFFPRARGKADIKQKPSSHITLVLTDELKRKNDKPKRKTKIGF